MFFHRHQDSHPRSAWPGIRSSFMAANSSKRRTPVMAGHPAIRTFRHKPSPSVLVNLKLTSNAVEASNAGSRQQSFSSREDR